MASQLTPSTMLPRLIRATGSLPIIHEFISNYQKSCRFSVDRLTHYSAAQFTDTATQPPERLCVRATVKSQTFTCKHPAWSAVPFPTEKEWLDMGMRFFEPALAMPISVQLVEDPARGSDDTPVPNALEEHAVIDAPMQPLLGIPPLFAGEMSPLSQNDHAHLLAQQAHHFMEHEVGSAG
eukprot:1244505-Prymnesium_polylepis.1